MHIARRGLHARGVHYAGPDRHPVVALFVEIAPELVDVNVHPAKTEVRFTRDGDVYGAVHKAVESALLTGGLVPEVHVQASLPLSTLPRPEERGYRPPRTALSTWGRSEVELPETSLPDPFAEDAPRPQRPMPLPQRAEPFSPIPWPTAAPSGDEEAPPHSADIVPPRAAEERLRDVLEIGDERESPAAIAAAWGSRATEEVDPPSYIGFDGHRIGRLRVLAQSRNTYIVAETDDALLLIDQHIAHERVLYEQMMNGATDRASAWGVVAQHLALPQTLELEQREARVARERTDALARAGFLVEPFGGDTLVVRAVPANLAHKDYMGTLREILDEMTNASLQRRLLVPHESAVIMASCKMAVKKGDPLTMEEMTRLLADLAKMKNPFTCPHGRPILLALPHREMDRKFHRIGPH